MAAQMDFDPQTRVPAVRLADCTRLQKRYLSRFVCWFCEARLDRDLCLGFGERCSTEIIEQRRANCLKHYRPRKRL